jgi:hypothetical protein
MVKLDLATFATKQAPGQQKCDQMEKDIRRGPLGFVPQIEHWAWEEFIYHGLPGDSWHPIDAYLAQAGERYPAEAAEQIRRWKEARIGLYEIGEVADDTVGLQEWDPIQRTHPGPPVRAITLNMGGVNINRDLRSKVLLTYLAPWRPDLNLYCGMGYGSTLPRDKCDLLVALLGLRHPEVACRPLPWKRDRAALARHLHTWGQRDWYTWFRERLTFPFHALIVLPPPKGVRIAEVERLMPSTPEDARRFGIYFGVPSGADEVKVAGGTAVTPVDITSANSLALAEYHEYRAHAGAPPGTGGAPTFWKVGPR